MKERFLVTGSTGFIGSRTVEALHKEGAVVRVLLRPESIVADEQREGIEISRGSYTDQEALRKAVVGVDRIIHLAGVTKAIDEAGFRDGNVTPALNLLKAAREYNPELKRFVLVSSLAAAGPASSCEPGVREADEPRPVSAYGRSKLLAEQVCLQQAGGVPLTIVRPPAVYGPGERDILEVFRMMKSGFLLSVGGWQRQRFSMVHVDDLVEGMLVAARSASAVGETYYITHSKPASWEDVERAAALVLGFKGLVTVPVPRPLVFALGYVLGAAAVLGGKPALFNSDKANELVQDFWVCSAEKAIKELGFTARTPLDEGVRSTVSWYQAKGWL